MSGNLPEGLADTLRRACVTAPLSRSIVAMRANGAPVTDAKRVELIEASRAGKHVEVDIDIVAFVQTPGVCNRNFIRFRPGRLQAIAKSGVGKPFLCDHAWGELAKAGGTITASKMVKNGAAREIHQTVRLSVPWAVEAALQGVMRFYSLGWWPTAPVHCSLCDAPIEDCIWERRHYRGSEHDGEVVELVYQDAELLETSAVNVPAVPETHTRDIRALDASQPEGTMSPEDAATALAELRQADAAFVLARLTGAADMARPVAAPTTPRNPEEPTMSQPASALARINAVLKLQPEASADATLEALSALQERATRAETAHGLAESQLADMKAERDQAVAERDQLRADKAALEVATRERDADAFVARAIEQGKCQANGKTADYFRGLFLANPDAAAETLEAAPVVTPVGQPTRTKKGQEKSQKNGQKNGAGNGQGDANEPDYTHLATQLSADDQDDAKRAGATPETYVRANYESLAGEYGWPPRNTNR